MKTPTAQFNRRDFLSTSATVTAGLVIYFYLPEKSGKVFAQDAAAAAKASYPPNAFIQIAPDNTITITINKLEMGQGVNTSLAQLIAEELDCDWQAIRTVSAKVNPVYNTVGFPIQLTGGSMSVRTSWDQHRKIGAGMREMLKKAAAQRWNVSMNDVQAADGVVINKASKAKFTYGELAEEAAKLPFPENPSLKEAKNYKIIGKSVKRLDAEAKANGQAIFGIDVRLPGMSYIAVARPSLRDAKLASFDEKAAKNVKGVTRIVRFKNKVAVFANNTYAARVGCDALKAKWNYGAHAKTTSESLMQTFKDEIKKPAKVAKIQGSPQNELKKAKSVLSAEYEFPFLAHAPMEPMNCTIRYDGKTAEIWAGHQIPGVDQQAACKILGLPPEKVQVNTVFAGGSFGRRACKDSDYVVEACEIAKIVKKPFKVTWSREDDMRGGYYRPMYYHKVDVGFDSNMQMQAWDHHIVGQSVVLDSFFGAGNKTGIDEPAVEGTADTPYKFANFRCQQSLVKTPLTTLWWRSVGHTHTAYVMESMIDEVAEKSGQDVFAFRRELLKDSPRQLAILDILEKKVKENFKKIQEGRAWGLAVHESFESVVGYVAEVSLDNGKPRVHRVWSAVHCGQVVHPEMAKTQIEGGMVFGLSGFFQKIHLKNGELSPINFDAYPVLRIQDMPQVFVDFVPSSAPPTGLGEPGVPPIAPAVANAIYKLTKKRIRSLPYEV